MTLPDKLQNPGYRKGFVRSKIDIRLPFQMRAMLESRGWNKSDLARRTGMTEHRISGILLGRTRPDVEALLRFSEAFDCGIIVRFAPFSELVQEENSLDPNLRIPPFSEDTPC